MGEFWSRNSQPDGAIFYGPHNHTIKEIACAAHIYGKELCQAEAFTSLADDFSEDPWSLKDLGDSAFCEGLTRMVFHNWPTHSRPGAQPGYWWIHIGTHFGYNLTWWSMANGWLTYLARCQHMLRQGFFVADFAYLQNEAIPSFVARRSDQQPPRPSGFDYDVLNAEAIQTRASAKGGRLELADGMSYRYLVLPHQPDAIVSPATLQKVCELVEAGVPVIGPTNLAVLVKNLRVGSLDAVTRADGMRPDIEMRDASQGTDFDWIHRRDGETEIYFLSNQSASKATASVVFRVAGKRPELWDAVTGRIRDLPERREEGPCTIVPMTFAPRQSWFVVFRGNRKEPAASGQQDEKNFPDLKREKKLSGPWTVEFDQKWFYPTDGMASDAAAGKVRFEKLEDWSRRPEPAIRYFSGTAIYRHTFDLEAAPLGRAFLDLGVVKNVARVRLNGRDLGVVWTAPWQVEITGVVKAKANELEIEIANLWPNRLIGDASLPLNQRRTVSNIATYDNQMSSDWLPGSAWARRECPNCSARLITGLPAALLPSGLLGPVTLQSTVPKAPEKELPMPGEVFFVAGRTAFVIPGKDVPADQAKPWVWYAPTLPGLPGREEVWMFEKFRDAGIAVAGIDVGESFGSPGGCALYSSLYDELTGKRGYSPKPVLLGRSRGGLMTLAWAAANPDKVAGFAGIYPVCNLASYPGVTKAAAAYELDPEALQARLAEYNPVERLAPLAKASVPLFAIHGDHDEVVPLEANSALLKTRYEALGGRMELVVPPGQGHNMWSGFFQCQELVEFVKAHAKP